MHPNPFISLSLNFCTLSLQPPAQKQNLKVKTNKKTKNKNEILAWKLECGPVSHISFSPWIFTWACSLQRVWFEALASATPSTLGSHWDSTWIPFSCLMPWRFCSFGFAGMAPLHSPADHRWDGCWVGCLVVLVLSLGGRWIGQPTSFPSSSPSVPASSVNVVDISPALTPFSAVQSHSYHQGQLYCFAQARCSTRSWTAALGEGQDQLFHSHAPRLVLPPVAGGGTGGRRICMFLFTLKLLLTDRYDGKHL